MTQRLAALTFQIDPAHKAVRLFPSGTFRSADGSGRPSDVPAWQLDAAGAAQLIARANARSDRKVVDYEHQTLKQQQNGQPAPAAGWMAALEWRDDGLYMTPDWTDKAASMIAAREYRYISPVFTYDKNGNVLDLLHAGLTNFAGLDGLADLAALSAHFFTPKEQPMKLLLAALGLAENTTEDKAVEAVAALKAQADGAETRIATLTAQAAQAPDPAKYVPMNTHSQTQNALASLTAKFEQSERDTLMEVALSDGRILAAQDAYWRAQPVAALKAYLEVAHPVAALSGTQTGGKKPEGEAGSTLDTAQIAMCSAMGIDPKAFAKTANSHQQLAVS
ncbi:MAG: phage protease [Sterolibacterium sp.]